MNIAGEPTYFVALKDGAGLVKKYAMINIQKYQWVAIGDTVGECEKNYSELLSVNGIVSQTQARQEEISGVIEVIAPVVLDGYTHYFICLEGNDAVFDADLSREELYGIVRLKEKDKVTLTYEKGYDLNEIRSFAR